MAPAAAQSILGFGGYSRSAFEDQDEAAGYVPVGAEVLFPVAPGLSVGAGLNYAVVPFTWDVEDEDTGEKLGEMKTTQLVLGGVARYEFGEADLRPMVRAGVGLYMGEMKIEVEEFDWLDVSVDLKNALGFNVGGGIVKDFGTKNFLLAEFVYHIVEREPEELIEDGDGVDASFGANNWAVHLGVGVKF